MSPRTHLVAAFGLSLGLAVPLIAQITFVKSTNGQDANTPPGPVLTVGSTVTWTYVITAGARDLTNVAVTDDKIGAVSCPSTTVAAGSSMTCTATGTVVAGQYSNLGTLTAMEAGVPVELTDPSNYFGQPAGLISLVKSTNGQDANNPPGPVVAVGSAVNWTYVVTNQSSQTITEISVTDNQGVVVTCPATSLTAGASMTCTASGLAQAGQYSNVGTVRATHPTSGTIFASDPSHYFGQAAVLDFGDAPDTYGTTLASNGARHALGSNVFLGACVDSEIDGQPSASANGDDTNVGSNSFGTCAVAGQDEDGVTFGGPLIAGTTASVTVVANAPCTLSAWMDFNANGTFDAADELFPGGVALGAGGNSLSFAVPQSAQSGATYARFRCTTDGPVGPLGGAHDGEVEDYRVTIFPPLADLSVTKADAPDPVTPGTNLTYTITATNGGPSNAVNMTLTDPLPAATTFVSLSSPAGWNCIAPAAGANGTVNCTHPFFAPGSAMFTLVVHVSPSASGTISNTATISAATTDPNPGDNSVTATTTVGPPLADLSITKGVAPNPVTPGTNLTYTIVATNAGPSSGINAALSDLLPPATTFVSLSSPAGWSCATPAVGSTGPVTCNNAAFAPGSATFTLVVAVNGGAVGTISNTATISSTSIDSNPANNSATATTATGPAVADLSITKSGAPNPVTAGNNLTYTIMAINGGPSNATTVTLTDVLPAGTTFVSMTPPPGWTCTPGATISCSNPTFAPGSATFTLVVAVNAAATGTINNTATIASTTTDPNPANNSATASNTTGASADLSVTKSGTPNPVPPGTNLTYTITATNAGPSSATSVTLTDAYPATTSFVSLIAAPGWTCTAGAAAMVCNNPLFAAGSATFTLVVRVSPGASGSIINIPTITAATADPNPANNSTTVTTTVASGSADLSLTKSDSPDPVNPGTNLTYTITATNAGPSNATTAALSDPLPAGTSFVSLTAPAGWTCTTPAVGATGTVSCSNASFVPGSATFTLVVAVAQNAPATITNTATVSSATADPNPANNSATATTSNTLLIPALSPTVLLLLALVLAAFGVVASYRI